MYIKEEILPYCKFYHNEVICPYYNDNLRGLLWMAERFVCEDAPHLITNDIKKSMYDVIESYVGKWNPYEQEEIMSIYNSTSSSS